jgi:hypothetical protein
MVIWYAPKIKYLFLVQNVESIDNSFELVKHPILRYLAQSTDNLENNATKLCYE